jgi:hypothetical protein
MSIISKALVSYLVLLSSATLPASAVPVTFQVNMAYQITNPAPTFDPLNDKVEVRGDFYNDWNSGFLLVQVGNTTAYTNTFDITSATPGSLVQYKFHTYGNDDDWESLPGDTVSLTLRVDMTSQILVGNFIPGSDTIEARGSWDGWSSGVTLTNNPTSATSNIYSQTLAIGSPAPGGLGAYKFHHYGYSPDTWESIDNRIFLATSPATVLPPAYFNNQETSDLLPADTYVTFSVNMTNAMGIDYYQFVPGQDPVYINGDFLGWWTWGNPPPQYQMIQVGNSEVYTNTLLIPKGNPVALTYKYGIDGFDDEAGFEENHVRYIRNTGSCVLPMDTFGTQLVEPVVGALNIAPSTPGHVNVSWGRLGVHLQTSTDLASGLWSDVLGTEAQSSTNYPVGPGKTFFRLVKP